MQDKADGLDNSHRREPLYVISVAARLAGLPSWVLRVLDQEGVVVPARTDSNRRLYCPEDIELLARVRHLTEERGVNIAGVKVILEMEQSASAPSPDSPVAPPPAPADAPSRLALPAANDTEALNTVNP
jgi:MerR family transcriptional regulator/heat shock protein HspR